MKKAYQKPKIEIIILEVEENLASNVNLSTEKNTIKPFSLGYEEGQEHIVPGK